MQVSVNELIPRARVYVDDDHKDEDSWLAPDAWLTLFDVEYRQLYRRWVRGGLITPAPIDTPFTGSTITIAGVLAIVGAAEDLGDRRRVLQPANSRLGRGSFWGGTADVGKSTQWDASGAGHSVAISLHPVDATGKYIARTVSQPTRITDPAALIDIPDGADERLVLGAVKRSGLKSLQSSQLLRELIQEADAELGFAAFGSVDGDSPRVRIVDSRRNTPPALFSVDPRTWRFM